ncbi:MAG TPA: hypothetical protein PL091_08995 [Actinomycetota bacterium]|nr:hypothetical protein [Actinomycetota bacterium]
MCDHTGSEATEAMRESPYYSVRTGKHPSGGTHDLNGLKRIFHAAFHQLQSDGYFQQALGYMCVDQGFVPGTVGENVEAFFFRKLKKPNLWPLATSLASWSEDDLFDVVELLHDVASKGVGGRYHSWNDCGWHYDTFDSEQGRNDYRAAVNECLREYDIGYQVTVRGEVVAIPPAGLGDLDQAPSPPADKEAVQDRVAAAVVKFRRRGASLDQRRDAVRDLADVLEFLRPQLKALLSSQDERDLFNLANNFGIRHHNASQKTNYDRAIWYSWLYYHYLAAIHAVTRMIDRGCPAPDEPTG